MAIIDEIALLIDDDDFIIGDIPSQGDILSLTEEQHKARGLDLGLYDNNYREVVIKFYVRKAPYEGVYSDIFKMLLDYHAELSSLVNTDLNGYFLTYVGEADINPAGRDKQGNFIFSLDVSIKYEERVH